MAAATASSTSMLLEGVWKIRPAASSETGAVAAAAAAVGLPGPRTASSGESSDFRVRGAVFSPTYDVLPSSTRSATSISGTSSKGLSGSRNAFPAFGRTRAACTSLRSSAVIIFDTLSARPCHLMPSCPTDGVASISTSGSSTKPNHSLSPGGGGIHTLSVPARRLTRIVTEMGTPTSFFATAPMSLLAFFVARSRIRRRFSSTALVSSPVPVLVPAPASAPAPASSRAHAPVPISSALTISAYTLRSMCVTSVISATPPNSISSSAAEHGPLFASTPRPTARRRRRPRSPRADARRAPAARISP